MWNVIRPVLFAIVFLALAIWGAERIGPRESHAQAAPTPQAPSCEQQLDAAFSANLGLQKELLQARYQTITLQEQLRDQAKKQAEAPTPKAAPAKADKK